MFPICTWYKSLMKLMLDNGLMSLARLFHFYKCIAKYHRNLEVNFWVNVRFADWNFSLELLNCLLLYESLPERQCNENVNLVQLFQQITNILPVEISELL